MNWFPLLGLLALAYAGLVFYLAAAKKPAAIWNMAKIQMFIKVLGEKGTIIFFYVWGVIFLGLAIWLFTL
ncbi:hypothetical protein [Candidatus Leptofilum sp.]|uniref:hypothetical protein n=1 Tax=Candidatus Leptofilum sp. TaxID=3241576 RepID=UPI003B5A3855